MKYLDEFRNKDAVNYYLQRIKKHVGKNKLAFMEVCGTHTMVISRYGIRSVLPENLRLISGPGCPVCVTPNGYMDHAIALGRRDDVIITTFGDMFRVPGSTSSIEKVRSEGGDILIVYSTMDALTVAGNNPEKKVVFLGVGFETTAPTIAASIIEAKERGLKNYYVLCAHKIIPPPMEALLLNERIGLDGFLCPGHVSVIIGSRPYEFIPEKYKKGCVVAGFEPVDVLASIDMLVNQMVSGEPAVEIQYKRVVKAEGNTAALRMMEEVFEVCDAEWRGIGLIPDSGLKINERYRNFDADVNIEADIEPLQERKGCICGLILQGLKTPPECTLFRKVCTPENPVGACMVSSEGTCAAYFKYGDVISNI